jgi:predicted urease superfamily metal-dependent hydrolase
LELVGNVHPSDRADAQILCSRRPESAKNLVGFCFDLARQLTERGVILGLAAVGRVDVRVVDEAAIDVISRAIRHCGLSLALFSPRQRRPDS